MLMNLQLRHFLLLIIAAGSLVGAGQVPAGAASPGTGSAVATGVVAGYDLARPNIRFGGGTLVVPTLDCTDGDGAIALGLGTYDGQPATQSVVILRCAAGIASYELVTVANGKRGDSDFNVNPGDHITVEYLTKRTHLVMMVLDHTSGAVSNATGVRPYDHHLTFGAFPIYEGATLLPVPDFGQVTQAATLNGRQLSRHGRTRLIRPMITTGRLSGAAFTLSYEG
jgi:hypothetical protein